MAEIGIDVIDDMRSESNEVNDHNPWLSLTEFLYRAREMGALGPPFDAIDDRILKPAEREEVLRIVHPDETTAPPMAYNATYDTMVPIIARRGRVTPATMGFWTVLAALLWGLFYVVPAVVIAVFYSGVLPPSMLTQICGFIGDVTGGKEPGPCVPGYRAPFGRS